MGTLEPRKNVGVLLDAWTLVAKADPRARLRVAGGVAPGGEEWLTRMRSAPLSQTVEYAGYVEPGARRALYEGARALILPSLHEGFGLPVLEAMSLGVPVIASNRGALPEVVGDAGLVVSAEDPRGLADAIRAVLGQPERAAAMRQRGLARAATFTWAAAARTLYDAYGRLLSGEAARAHRH